MLRRLIPVLLLALLAPIAPSMGVETQPSSAETLAGISNITAAKWLADGKSVVYLATVDGISQLWRVAASGGEPQQVTKGDDPIFGLAPSPADDNLVALETAVGDAGSPRCSLFDLAAGSAQAIGEPGADCLIGAWSRDGKRLAYSANQRTPAALDVYVMEVAKREARLVARGDGDWRAVAFSPSGERLVVQQRESTANQNLHLVDLTRTEPKATLLTPHGGWALYEKARWPVGPRSARGFFLLSNLARDVCRLAYFQAEQGALEYQERGLGESDRLEFSHNGVTMAIADNVQGLSRLGVQDVASGRWLPSPKLPEGVLRDAAVSPFGERLALIYANPTDPAELFVAAAQSGETRRLTKVGGGSADGSLPRLVLCRASDDRPIAASLYLPNGLAAGAKTPLAILAPRHVGEQHRPEFQPFVQFLVKQGFAVLAVNVRGTAGYGKEYFYLDDRAKRADAARDLADAASFMRKTDQRIDADRVAVLGESYGGWLALEALALAPDRFQAGVAAAPILDLERFIGRAAAWRRKALEAEFGSVTDDRDLLRALSPASRPERVKTPLLLIGGRRDPTTVMAELDSFAKAVRSGSVTADLVAYDDEAHELRRPKNVADSWTKIAAFLKATLKITPVASPPSPSPPSAATP